MTADEADKMIEELNPDLLFLDIQMPGMNGLQLQSELAAAGYGIPVIFITAYDDKASRGRAMQAGAVAFLDKPFSDEQLLQTVRSALRHDNSSNKNWSNNNSSNNNSRSNNSSINNTSSNNNGDGSCITS